MNAAVLVIQAFLPMTVAFTFYFAWMPGVHVKRVMSLPGSHQRYVWNTLERLLRWPAASVCFVPFAPLVGLVDAPAVARVLAVASALITTLAYGYAYRIARRADRDDDDDWFSRTGRRFRLWVRSGKHVRRAGGAVADG